MSRNVVAAYLQWLVYMQYVLQVIVIDVGRSLLAHLVIRDLNTSAREES